MMVGEVQGSGLLFNQAGAEIKLRLYQFLFLTARKGKFRNFGRVGYRFIFSIPLSEEKR